MPTPGALSATSPVASDPYSLHSPSCGADSSALSVSDSGQPSGSAWTTRVTLVAPPQLLFPTGEPRNPSVQKAKRTVPSVTSSPHHAAAARAAASRGELNLMLPSSLSAHTLPDSPTTLDVRACDTAAASRGTRRSPLAPSRLDTSGPVRVHSPNSSHDNRARMKDFLVGVSSNSPPKPSAAAFRVTSSGNPKSSSAASLLSAPSVLEGKGSGDSVPSAAFNSSEMYNVAADATNASKPTVYPIGSTTNNTVSSGLSTGSAAVIGNFWAPPVTDALRGGALLGRGDLLSANGTGGAVSMTGMAFDPAVPADLPPESSKLCSQAATSLSDQISLSGQRVIADRHTVMPIHLDEGASFNSFMSLSSGGLASRGSLQAAQSCTQNSPSRRQRQLGTVEPSHLTHVSDVENSAAAGKHKAPAVDSLTELNPPECLVHDHPTLGSGHLKYVSFAVSQSDAHNATRAPTPIQLAPLERPKSSSCTSSNRPSTGMPIEAYAILQLCEFEVRAEFVQAEAKAWEALQAKEVSDYLLCSRRARYDFKATHKPSHTIPTLEEEEKALFATHIQERLTRLRAEHRSAMQVLSKRVPPQQPTTLSRLSSENMSDIYAMAAPEPHDAALPHHTTFSNGERPSHASGEFAALNEMSVDAEVARQIAVRRFLSRNAGNRLTFFPDYGQ